MRFWRGLLLLLLLLFPATGRVFAADGDYPKYEIRAVWLTTIFGLDWPGQPAADAAGQARQKQELCHMLDRLKEANFNTVFIQTRLRGDVIYPSAIEPVSKVFTGKYGLMPGYDPLAFAIEECHRRGMECHAFLVTFPVGSDKVVREQGASSVVERHRALCLHHRNEWYLDPGLPGTSAYILSLVREIVHNYDIDGIQFDYIRYPDGAQSFPDGESYAAYGRGKSLADWRRDNITRLVTLVYDWVKQEKPWVQVSSSPLGKYSKAQHPNAKWTAYDDVYQDPVAWFQAGKHDMIVPMMYYRQNDFYPYVSNWTEQARPRNMVAGLGAYRLDKREGDWALSEIRDQIKYVRKQGVSGCAFFRTRFVLEQEKGLYNELKEYFYKYPAQLPPLTWMSDAKTPDAPQEIVVTREQNRLKLSWQDSSGAGEKEHTYTVYYSLADSIHTDRAQSILATGLRETELYLPVERGTEKGYMFTVTASDRYRMESRPSHETYYYVSGYEK
jgi:uncharacterized lipoprotein YddW (UPF0748 family)